MTDANALAGRRILVPESRELDLFVKMLESHGAIAERCPLVAILDLQDTAEAEAWLGRLAFSGFDDLILLTGEGLRRLLTLAEHARLKSEVIAAIGKLRTIVRGPKPARALREIGLAPGLSAVQPTTAGVIETLSALDLKGRRIGVQLYPDNPNGALLDFLSEAGAAPDPVVPYRYASDIETGSVAAAIQRMADGQVDLVAFTSTPQIRRLADVAHTRGLETELKAGLMRTRIAAVGPVVAAALEKIGARPMAMPDNSFHLKPLVKAIVASFEKSAA